MRRTGRWLIACATRAADQILPLLPESIALKEWYTYGTMYMNSRFWELCRLCVPDQDFEGPCSGRSIPFDPIRPLEVVSHVSLSVTTGHVYKLVNGVIVAESISGRVSLRRNSGLSEIEKKSGSCWFDRIVAAKLEAAITTSQQRCFRRRCDGLDSVWHLMLAVFFRVAVSSGSV